MVSFALNLKFVSAGLESANGGLRHLIGTDGAVLRAIVALVALAAYNPEPYWRLCGCLLGKRDNCRKSVLMIELLNWFVAGKAPDAVVFVLVGSLAAAIFSMGKAGFGGGAGLLALPLLTFATGDPLVAVAIMLPLLIVSDYVAFFSWYRQWSVKAVSLLLPGMVLGTALGTWILWWLGQLNQQSTRDKPLGSQVLMLIIGLLALGFVILHIVRSRRKEPFNFKPVLWNGSLFGGVAGITSTLAHAAAPIVTIYMVTQGMDKRRFVASATLYFWVGNQLKVLPFLLLGLLDLNVFRAIIPLIPAAIVGALLGVWLNGRVSQQLFTLIIYVLLTITAAELIYRSVSGLMA